MKKDILTLDEILEFINKNPGISSTLLAKYFEVTTVAIFYKLRELIKQNKIQVVWRSRSTRYFVQKSYSIPYDIDNTLSDLKYELEDVYENFENWDIKKLLQETVLILTPEGEWKEGIDALYEIIRKENHSKQPSLELFSRRLQSFLEEYLDEEQKRRKNGFFEWTQSIRYTLEKYNEECFVNHVYFCELNKLWHWWKLRTGTELYHGKSLQDKKLLISAVDKTILRIQQFFIKKWVDAIILTPPTIPRRVQFRDVFMERLGGITFPIRVEKVKDKNFRPQKELKWKDRFINASLSLIVDIPTDISLRKHIVIIDDNFTTGATVNAIAGKLRAGGFNWEITVITVTGNFWYVPWVTDDEEI